MLSGTFANAMALHSDEAQNNKRNLAPEQASATIKISDLSHIQRAQQRSQEDKPIILRSRTKIDKVISLVWHAQLPLLKIQVDDWLNGCQLSEYLDRLRVRLHWDALFQSTARDWAWLGFGRAFGRRRCRGRWTGFRWGSNRCAEPLRGASTRWCRETEGSEQNGGAENALGDRPGERASGGAENSFGDGPTSWREQGGASTLWCRK